MVFASFAEIVSIGAVLPFLGVLTAPVSVFNHPVTQPLIRFLNVTSADQLLLPLTLGFGAAVLAAGAMRLLLLYTTWPFLRNSFMINEGSPDPGGIPARWVLKSTIIIGFLLLVLQGISQAVKNYYVAKGWEEPEQRVKEIH